MNFSKIIKNTLSFKPSPAFGLDIDDRSIEIIELEKNFSFSTVTFGRIELPVGVIENGKIKNENILAEKLKELLRQAKPTKVSTNKVILSIPESQVFIKSFEVDSGLRFSALTKAVTQEISLTLPINIDKTYWDFVEKELPEKTKKLIMFFCIPKEVANSYVKFCNSIGLEIVSLSIEALCLARAILVPSDKQSLIINLGSRTTDLSFFDSNDKINMSVTVPYAGEQMTKIIEDKLKIDWAEAESLKIKFGFSDIAENNIKELITPIITDTLKEAKQAIDYYERVFRQQLDNVYIVGGSALLPDIIKIISSTLGREVVMAKNILNMKADPFVNNENSFPVFAAVIGLGVLGATREFENMNLLGKIPSSEVATTGEMDLFGMGYLSKKGVYRSIFNNKYIWLGILVLVGMVGGVIFQQIRGKTANVAPTLPVNISPAVTPVVNPIISTSTDINSFGNPNSSTSTEITNNTISTTTDIINHYIFMENKDPGSNGDSVLNLQARLTEEGYYSGLVGGFFGPATEQAVIAYQKANSLPTTGKLDPVTRQKLNSK